MEPRIPAQHVGLPGRPGSRKPCLGRPLQHVLLDRPEVVLVWGDPDAVLALRGQRSGGDAERFRSRCLRQPQVGRTPPQTHAMFGLNRSSRRPVYAFSTRALMSEYAAPMSLPSASAFVAVPGLSFT